MEETDNKWLMIMIGVSGECFFWYWLTRVVAEHTHTQPFYGSMDFFRDNPGEPVPEETFTHSHYIK